MLSIMLNPTHSRSESSPDRRLFWFSFATLLFAIPTIYMGSFTTTIGAGMIFPDWPTSNGSFNPDGWWIDRDMFAEHSHRLFAGVTALLTLTLLWLHLNRESRKWLRRLSVAAAGLVILQALMGGLRVIFDDVNWAIPHAFAGQAYFCMLAALFFAHTNTWRQNSLTRKNLHELRYYRLCGMLVVCLIFLQLIVGAVMRHHGAGLAIAYFPYSTANGSLLPEFWNYGITVHFLHRVGALLITLGFVVWLFMSWRIRMLPRFLKIGTTIATAVLCIQIALGASIIWTTRGAIPTSVHVIVGALLLGCCVVLNLYVWRPIFERTIDKNTSPSIHDTPDGNLTRATNALY